MVQLQKSKEQFEKAGLQIVGLSYDNLDVLKKFAEKKAIEFPLLSDQGSQVIRQLDLEFKGGLPHPGTIVVDQSGTVRAKIFKKGYVQRHSVKELLDSAASLKGDKKPSNETEEADR